MGKENMKMKNLIEKERQHLRTVNGADGARRIIQYIERRVEKEKQTLLRTKETKFERLCNEPKWNQARGTRTRRNRRKQSSQKKNTRREEKLRRKEQLLISKLQDIELPPADRFTPFDNTDYEMTEEQRSLCAKGLKFVPATPRVDYNKKQRDFEDFARKLRLSVYFGNPGRVEDENEAEYEKKPWDKKNGHPRGTVRN